MLQITSDTLLRLISGERTKGGNKTIPSYLTIRPGKKTIALLGTFLEQHNTIPLRDKPSSSSPP